MNKTRKEGKYAEHWTTRAPRWFRRAHSEGRIQKIKRVSKIVKLLQRREAAKQ